MFEIHFERIITHYFFVVLLIKYLLRLGVRRWTLSRDRLTAVTAPVLSTLPVAIPLSATLIKTGGNLEMQDDLATTPMHHRRRSRRRQGASLHLQWSFEEKEKKI